MMITLYPRFSYDPERGWVILVLIAVVCVFKLLWKIYSKKNNSDEED